MSCGNSRSSKCNPCGPSADAMNAIADRAAYYARIAVNAAETITGNIIYSDTTPEGFAGVEWVDTTTMKRYQWYSDSWIETFGGNNGVTTSGSTGGTNITVSSIQPSTANEGDMWTNLDTYIQFQYISGIWIQV